MATERPGVRARGFRGDIEGLRAVAVGLVLLYHAGLPLLPGGFAGVDVFFVISGFLITTQLVTELERTGRVSLARFYARRAKRLLPAAAVVLAATVVLGRLFLPRIRWEEVGGDVVSAALYVVNWRLAGRSVDYLAEDSAPSPVQHYWSLAVEEQYYLVWPLLIMGIALAVRAARRRPRPALLLGLAAVAVPSFVWSVLETARSPESAYFVTTTRIWQLAVGAAVALAAVRLARLPRPAAVGLGWAGLAAIALSGVAFSASTPWPGYAAAVPTLGTAAVISAGFASPRGGPAALLDTAPLRWIGARSYSLYLWHWPLLVVVAAYVGGLSTPAGLAVAALCVVPAWLTYRFVENPLRHSPGVSRSPRFALSLGANFTLAGVVAGLFLTLSVSTTAVPAGDRPPAPGAAVLGDDPRSDPDGRPVDQVGWITPDPLQATKDVPDLYADGCQQGVAEPEVLVCEYGDLKSEFTIAVVGDSKIGQWLPALRPIAEGNGWRLVTYTKSACPFAVATPQWEGEPYRSCREWNDAVLDRLTTDPPEYVLTSQRATKALGADNEWTEDAIVAGMRAAWSELTARGTEIIVIADNPRPDLTVYECVSQNEAALTACTYDRDLYEQSAAPVQKRAADGEPNVTVVDLFDAICPSAECAPVIGNVLVYRQGSHLTATYVETLTPRLAEALTAAGMPTDRRRAPTPS